MKVFISNEQFLFEKNSLMTFCNKIGDVHFVEFFIGLHFHGKNCKTKITVATFHIVPVEQGISSIGQECLL